MMDERRALVVRLLSWAGLLGPAAIVVTRSGERLTEDPLAPIAILRGVTPGLFLLTALAVSRTPLRPLDAREWWLTAYLSVAAASTLWSIVPMATLLKAGHLAIAYGLLVVLARHWRDRTQAMNELATVAYVIVFIAAIGAVLWPEEAFWGWQWAGWGGRLRTLLPALHQVSVGLFAALAVVLALGRRGPSWLQVRPWLLGVTGAVAGTVLLFTRTRSALLLVVGGMVSLLWLQGRRRLVAGVGATMAGVALFEILSRGSGPLASRLLRGRSPEDFLFLSGRIPAWRDAVDLWMERPALGFGHYAGHRFGPYAERFTERSEWETQPILDGTWIATLLELGILGAVVLFGFVAVCSWALWRGRDADDPGWQAQVTVLAMIVAFSLFDSTLEQVQYSLVITGTGLLATATVNHASTGSPDDGDGSGRATVGQSVRLWGQVLGDGTVLRANADGLGPVSEFGAARRCLLIGGPRAMPLADVVIGRRASR